MPGRLPGRRQFHRPGQRRVCGQDPLLQLLQVGSWFDPEFLDKDAAGMPVGGKRFGLTAVAVQGHHQQRVKVLPQRRGGYQLPRFLDHLAVLI